MSSFRVASHSAIGRASCPSAFPFPACSSRCLSLSAFGFRRAFRRAVTAIPPLPLARHPRPKRGCRVAPLTLLTVLQRAPLWDTALPWRCSAASYCATVQTGSGPASSRAFAEPPPGPIRRANSAPIQSRLKRFLSWCSRKSCLRARCVARNLRRASHLRRAGYNYRRRLRCP